MTMPTGWSGSSASSTSSKLGGHSPLTTYVASSPKTLVGGEHVGMK